MSGALIPGTMSVAVHRVCQLFTQRPNPPDAPTDAVTSRDPHQAAMRCPEPPSPAHFCSKVPVDRSDLESKPKPSAEAFATLQHIQTSVLFSGTLRL